MGTLRSKVRHVAAPLAAIAFVAVMVMAESTPADIDPSGVDDPLPVDPHEEPTTGDPVDPEPGDESDTLRPFDPPPESDRAVSLDALTADEQAYVVSNANVDGADQVHAGFSAATHQAAEGAEAQAAANALGIAGIAIIGVVQ